MDMNTKFLQEVHDGIESNIAKTRSCMIDNLEKMDKTVHSKLQNSVAAMEKLEEKFNIVKSSVDRLCSQVETSQRSSHRGNHQWSSNGGKIMGKKLGRRSYPYEEYQP